MVLFTYISVDMQFAENSIVLDFAWCLSDFITLVGVFVM